MQADNRLQRVGEVPAPFRLALGEGLTLAAVGGGQVVGSGQQRAEELAVVDHAADGNAAEADAVIGALAPDQALARAGPAHVVIGDGDLQRRVGGLRAGIGEEHVVEIARRQRGQARGQLKGQGMAELEVRGEVEFGRLALDRRDDRGAAVAGVAAPKGRRRVENCAPLRRVVVHVLGARDQARPLLERAIGRERHPERGEIIGNFGALSGGGHRGSPGFDGISEQCSRLCPLSSCRFVRAVPNHEHTNTGDRDLEVGPRAASDARALQARRQAALASGRGSRPRRQGATVAGSRRTAPSHVTHRGTRPAFRR